MLEGGVPIYSTPEVPNKFSSKYIFKNNIFFVLMWTKVKRHNINALEQSNFQLK